MTWGLNMSTVICPYPASCMGKTVMNKSLLLLYTTVAMPELGISAGIAALKSHHKLHQHKNCTCAHAWKEVGRVQGQLLFRDHKSPDKRGAIHLLISKPWFFWRLRILISRGSFCWIISISGNKTRFCLSLLFFQLLHLSFLVQGNAVMKNTSFEGQP